jgi:hypothetical protein
MDETVLSRMMNGFREPTRDLQERIAALLNCDADWLFEKIDQVQAAEVSPTLK